MSASASLILLLAFGQPLEFAAARQHFEAGVQFLDNDRFSDAVGAFEKSLKLRRGLPTLYNLGLAYRGAKKQKEALKTLEAFLDQATKLEDCKASLHGVGGGGVPPLLKLMYFVL